jgi:hypothetical protein
MKTRLLDATEFKSTFAEPMRDVLATAKNVIDIWSYVAAIPTNELFGNTIVDGCVEHVYRNGNDTFDHVLVVTRTKNVLVAVVIDLVRDTIFGHHLLDLNQEYGLTVRH